MCRPSFRIVSAPHVNLTTRPLSGPICNLRVMKRSVGIAQNCFHNLISTVSVAGENASAVRRINKVAQRRGTLPKKRSELPPGLV